VVETGSGDVKQAVSLANSLTTSALQPESGKATLLGRLQNRFIVLGFEIFVQVSK